MSQTNATGRGLRVAEMARALLEQTAEPVTVSPAGIRARIAATGDQEMCRLSIHGPGGGIVRATLHGTTPDDRGLWAEVNLERTT
jgi:hypothetical protein